MNTRTVRGIALALSLCLALAGSQALAAGAARGEAAPALPKGAVKVTAVEGITEYRLENGLRVLLFPDPSKDTITVNITYLVGSRHEGYGETGMAHLLEHLLFKGTPKHPDIPQELTAHGSRPNGSTWYDRTNYFETFAATEENLDWALDLEADRMVNSFVAKKDLDSEMSVVRNEFEIGENYPQNVLIERMMSAAYLWHNYGKSTIGSRADIERVPIERLQAFYKAWYRPDNAVLVVAGKIDEPSTLAKVAEVFGKVPRPSQPIPSTYTAEPAQDGERTVGLRRVGDTQMVGALYHVPPASHPDYVGVDLLTFILGDTPSGRLHEALVETKKAASVFGFAFPLREPGVMFFGAELRTEHSLDDARETLLRVTEELVGTPATTEEVQRARDNRLKEWETTMRQSERAAIELSEWSAMGDWRLMFVHRDRLEAATPQDVSRAARAYLKRENRTVGVYVPTEEPTRVDIPDAPVVATLVEGYQGREALSMGESFDPTPKVIEARAERRTVAPGIRLVLVPKKTRGETVQARLTLHFGDEAGLQGRGTAGGLVGGMLMRGTKDRTREQIQDEIDRLRAQIRVDGGPTSAQASIEATRENLPAALRLVAEMLREPSFPQDEFEILRQERLVAFEDSKSDPTQIASTALERHLNPWPAADPRYVETPEEAIASTKAATLDEVRRFHADFYGASVAEAAVVGDFDPDQLATLVKELFGDWKSRKPYARLVDRYQDRPAIQEMLEAPDKESAFMLAGLRIELRDDAPEYPALALGNFMTGGGFLNSRLATRIRRTDGLSYGVGSWFMASAFDKDALFGSYAIYAPQNADRLVAAYKEEIAKILDDGFTEQEIAEAKQGWLQSRRVSRSSDRELASTLVAREHEKRTLAWDEAVESKVAALTNAEIVAAMKKHINPAKISLVQAGDFARVKAQAPAEKGIEAASAR
jgi:zinc protease